MRHAAELLELADAIVRRDPATIATTGAKLRAALGDAGWVDAVAVVANFERMVRIADGTGIPLDATIRMLAGGLDRDLELGRFGSARNTPPPGLVLRLLGPLLRPLARRALRRRATR